MAIRGNLREASLADVLQLLALGQKTGCLSVAREGSFGSIDFVEGRIVHASLINRQDRLADRLVRLGALAPDVLTQLRAEGRASEDRQLAHALLHRGLVDRELLLAQYRAEVEQTVYHLFGWTQGTFTFEAIDEAHHAHETPDGGPLLSLGADGVLLEGARRVDEWSVIARKIPTLDLIFEVDPQRVAVREGTWSAEQERLLPCIDGTLDVHALMERSGLGEYEVGKALYGLLSAGYIQRVGRSLSRQETPPEHRVAEYRNLGVAFYRTGMLDEALREFRRVLELRDGDAVAQFHIGLVHARRGEWRECVAALTPVARQPEAPVAVLQNLALGLEQLGDLRGAQRVLQDALARAGETPDPRLLVQSAALHLQTQALADAQAQLYAARALWTARRPPALWYHVSGLVAACAGDLLQAATILEEGVGLYPQAVALHNNLAVVQERAGRAELAARTLEHALLHDADCPHLHKNLGDYHYRGQRYDEAFAAYARVLRLAPAHGPDVYLKVGNLHYRRGALHEAQAAWEQALSLDPGSRVAQANLTALHSTT